MTMTRLVSGFAGSPGAGGGGGSERLQRVDLEPKAMEKAEMMARLLDHHARVHSPGVRDAIEKMCINLAREPLLMYMADGPAAP